MDKSNNIIYKEIQRFNQIWLIAIIAIVSLIGFYGFIKQVIMGVPFGHNPAPDWLMYVLLILFGFGFPFMLAYFRLVTEIYPDKLVIRLIPFHRKEIPINKIDSFQIITYRPIMDCGGWGVRWNTRGGMAYTASGKVAVDLTLLGQKPIWLGTQNPIEIEAVLNRVINRLDSSNKI